MDIPANLPQEKLPEWAYAVHYAQLVLQQQIARGKTLGLTCDYDELTITRLAELEQQLNLSWSQHMTDLEHRAVQVQVALKEMGHHG
jgi:hypothetical protein